MKKLTRRSILMASLALFAAIDPLASLSIAAEREKSNTVMTVGEMCRGCVTKISKRFKEVKEVAEVKCDIVGKSVTVIPKKGVHLSPKAVWEIMEDIGKTPIKMDSPEGTFRDKPKS